MSENQKTFSPKEGAELEVRHVVNLVQASALTPEPISWLWNGWLAVGKLHVLGGAPGTGKTTIAMSLAATVTKGEAWPDGTVSPMGNVVIWSGEDDPKDTLIPRLAASGADLDRVYFISHVVVGSQRRAFDPAKDMEHLKTELLRIENVRVLIVDPIVSAVSGDTHKNGEVRRGLQPLADLAASMQFALIGITHFSKGSVGREPVDRISGSVAFGAVARIVMVAAVRKTSGNDGGRILCRAKSNIGLDSGGFDYELKQSELTGYPGIVASSVTWGNAIDGSARELLAEADSTGNGGKISSLADAKRFLSDLLTPGPLPFKTIESEAKDAGHALGTIRRAQKALEIQASKDGMQGGWIWALPDTKTAETGDSKVLN